LAGKVARQQYRCSEQSDTETDSGMKKKKNNKKVCGICKKNEGRYEDLFYNVIICKQCLIVCLIVENSNQIINEKGRGSKTLEIQLDNKKMCELCEENEAANDCTFFNICTKCISEFENGMKNIVIKMPNNKGMSAEIVKIKKKGEKEE